MIEGISAQSTVFRKLYLDTSMPPEALFWLLFTWSLSISLSKTKTVQRCGFWLIGIRRLLESWETSMEFSKASGRQIGFAEYDWHLC
jgi:hypothetical protein